MAEVGLTEAAALTGKDPSTIARRSNHPDMSKRLSFRINEQGERVYDVSELERVFGKLKTPDAMSGGIARNDAISLQSNIMQAASNALHERENVLLQQQIALLQAQLDSTNQDRDHWRHQATYLLEDKSKKESVIHTHIEEQQAMREKLARQEAEKEQLAARLNETQNSLEKVKASRLGRLLFRV
jgi:flagellar biosynthesis GTPase FlhF